MVDIIFNKFLIVIYSISHKKLDFPNSIININYIYNGATY